MVFCPSFPFLFFLILAVASFQDLTTRTVSDSLWISAIFLFFCFNFNSISYFIVRFKNDFFVFVFLFFAFQLMFRFKMMGGADLKCLLSVFLFFPYFFMSVFLNSLILTLLYPIFIFGYNMLFHFKDVLSKPHYAFFGYRKDIFSILTEQKNIKKEKINEKCGIYLLERIDFKTNSASFVPFGVDIFSDEEEDYRFCLLSKMQSDGCYKKQWVSPKIPFIVSITAGYVLSAVFGNLLFIFSFQAPISFFGL